VDYDKVLQTFSYFRQGNVMVVFDTITRSLPLRSLYIIWLVHSLIIGHLKIKNYKFERVASFKYVEVLLNGDNNNQIDLQERTKNANKTYFMLLKFFKNKNITRKLKLSLKNTIIDKTLTYASETWTITKRDRKQLNVF
jgi:hypothetical protein